MSQATLAIIIVVIAIISFALEKIPVALTAIIAALAMAISGIIPLTKAYSDFGSVAVVMVASMMVVGNACFENGVAQALGRSLFKLGLGKNERLLCATMAGFSCFLSAFFSNSAVVAMLIPLVASICSKSEGRCENKMVLMAVGMGAAAGGFCTLSGSTPQAAAQTILTETEGLVPMKYFTLAKAGLPLCILFTAYFATIGYAIMKKVLTFPDVIPVDLSEVDETKPIDKRKFYTTAAIAIFTIVGFVSGIWSITIVAMVGAALIFLTRCMDIKPAMRGLDWSSLIVLACSQGFAAGIDKSGAGALIADTLLKQLGANATKMTVLIVIFVVTVILTNIMSNIATCAMIFPIALSLATDIGANPTTYIIAITIACQCAFSTPIGTPCVTQTMVGGYRFMDYVKVGLPINILMTIGAIILIPICYGL